MSWSPVPLRSSDRVSKTLRIVRDPFWDTCRFRPLMRADALLTCPGTWCWGLRYESAAPTTAAGLESTATMAPADPE